ncbi:MAG TPA: GUN4 domain-containing protein, partial [Coleofasciculaceae cyanobacterium]
MKKILILASNPRKDLNLDHEIRDLTEVVERSRHQDRLQVVSKLAVRVSDLQALLLEHQPQIVHFCGHGGGNDGLVFDSDVGQEHRVRTEALADLFRLFSSSVECVLLNACYSEEQASAIVTHINYVIGMRQEIQDHAAIAFSKGFYRGLGYARSIEQSYELGCNAIQLEISGSSVVRSAKSEVQRRLEVVNAIAKTVIPEHLKPILKKKKTLMPPSGSALTLSQADQVAMQLDVDQLLKEEPASLKQYREQVRQYLSDRILTKFEEIRLEQLRKQLNLSIEAVNRVLAEEQESIWQAQQAYQEMLTGLVESGCYPFSPAIAADLQQFRQELQLTDQEVNQLSQPILEIAEAAYRRLPAGNAEKTPEVVQAEPQRQPCPSCPPGDDLASERNINYTRLRDLLQAGNWQDADDETRNVLLKIADRQQGISEADIHQFPCTDLRTLDQLWTQYSNGQF